MLTVCAGRVYRDALVAECAGKLWQGVYRVCRELCLWQASAQPNNYQDKQQQHKDNNEKTVELLS